jgi:ubiquinone/menaquinone biosynthesis C-methylase UbiE
MMERTLEPELMNDENQAKAYAFADFSEPHDLFLDKFQEKFPGLSYNDVMLDLGCGPCDITRRLACAYPDASFHAVDGAAAMLKYGQELNEQAGLSSRIKLIETCLPQVELPQKYYHLIISNSLLHHLHNPVDLWATIQQHAKPYASVFVMDLMRPSDEATVRYFSQEYAKNEPYILKRDFEKSLRAAFTIEEVRQQLGEIGLAQLNVEEASDRHMLIYGVI